MLDRPRISVIIPAYNEADRIGGALASIRAQTYRRLEIIVVANACTDETAEVAEEEADVVWKIEEKGISHAKNFGYHRAGGDVLAFMDADSIAKEDLLDKVVEAINRGYEGGKARVVSLDDPSWKAALLDAYRDVWALASTPLARDSGGGAFTFLTRDLARRVVLQNGQLYSEEHQVMEDINLAMRMKAKGDWTYIRDSWIYTSMRRFMEEGYAKCMWEDFLHARSPIGKTRQRWNV